MQRIVKEFDEDESRAKGIAGLVLDAVPAGVLKYTVSRVNRKVRIIYFQEERPGDGQA